VAATPGSGESVGAVCVKADRHFVHHLILTNGARYIRHYQFRRKELADKTTPSGSCVRPGPQLARTRTTPSGEDGEEREASQKLHQIGNKRVGVALK
jgi:hypothetical protein